MGGGGGGWFKLRNLKIKRDLTIKQNFTNLFTNKIYLRQGKDAIIVLQSIQHGSLDLVIQRPNY